MLRKMPWTDRIGILTAVLAVFAIAFLWWTGWAALKALIFAAVVAFVFAFLLMWAAHRRDDNPDNDTAAAVLKGMKAETWDVIVAKARKGSSDDGKA